MMNNFLFFIIIYLYYQQFLQVNNHKLSSSYQLQPMISQLANKSKSQAICQCLLQAGKRQFQLNSHQASKAVEIFKLVYEFEIPLYKLKACEAIVKCYQKQNNIENVLVWLNNIRKITIQQSQNIKLRLVNCYQKLGNKQKMFQLRKKIAKDELQLCKVYQQQKQYKKCIEIIQTKLKQNLNSQQLIIKLSHLCQLAFQFQKKALFYGRMLQIHPNEPIHYIRQAENLNKLQKYNDALALAEKGLSLFGGKQRDQFYLTKGTIYLDKMDSNQAIYNFNQALQINSQNKLAFYQIAKAYKENCQYKEAIKVLQRFKQDNKTANIITLAQCYYLNRQLKKYEQTIAFIQKHQNLSIFLTLLKAKIYSHQLLFEKSNQLLLQINKQNKENQLKIIIIQLIAYNYRKMKYFQMANKYQFWVTKLHPASISITYDLHENWAEIKSLLRQRHFSGNLQKLFNNGQANNYRHFLLLLRLCQLLKKNQTFQVYQKNLDILAHLSVQQQIVVLTHLVCVFQQTNKTDITTQMYNQLYEIMTELFTPNSTKVLHEQYLKIIELSLKMNHIEKAIILLERIENFVKDLRNQGYVQLAESLMEYFKGVREKINKKN